MAIESREVPVITAFISESEPNQRHDERVHLMLHCSLHREVIIVKQPQNIQLFLRAVHQTT